MKKRRSQAALGVSSPSQLPTHNISMASHLPPRNITPDFSSWKVSQIGSNRQISLLSLVLVFILFSSCFVMMLLPHHSKVALSIASNTVEHSLSHFHLQNSSISSTHKNFESASKTNKTAESQTVIVSPLRPIDYEKFTVRINTWKRTEQLHVSIQHHLSCPSVAQIQIVWCVDQGPVPDWLRDEERVVVEEHSENSLNERFRILHQPTTFGILSIDDDVLRPCLALESAFARWKANPDRIVGFDARSHQVVRGETTEPKWKYGYLSTTEHANAYSITLTRCCFVHCDYLRSYWTTMPSSIRDTVAQHLNCEDIAMSLWVSAQTGGRPPLLADYWVVKSQIKLYVPSKISGGSDHKGIRDQCMNDFADVLELKDRLQLTTLQHRNVFWYGAEADNWNQEHEKRAASSLLHETVQRWRLEGPQAMMEAVKDLIAEAQGLAYHQGLIEGTSPWKKRFRI